MAVSDQLRHVVGDAQFNRAMQNSAFSSAMSTADSVGALPPSSNWFERTFDPAGTEMEYNAYQAAVDRAFSAKEAEKAWQRSQKSADIAYERSAYEARLQRDFEERMSNTAYQRAVADMKRVGLNPYALYGSSSAASTPSGTAGSAYTASSPAASSSGARIAGGRNTAVFDLVRSVVNSAFVLAKFL